MSSLNVKNINSYNEKSKKSSCHWEKTYTKMFRPELIMKQDSPFMKKRNTS